ncbi:hypothetical protein ES703_46934 [subsurface metagenome]
MRMLGIEPYRPSPTEIAEWILMKLAPKAMSRRVIKTLRDYSQLLQLLSNVFNDWPVRWSILIFETTERIHYINDVTAGTKPK